MISSQHKPARQGAARNEWQGVHGLNYYVDISAEKRVMGKTHSKRLCNEKDLGNFLLHSELPLIELKNRISYDFSQESCQN